MVRNDGTSYEKKFLSPRDKRDIYDPYVWYIDRKILAKDLSESFLNNLYDGHIPREWAEKKSDQLHNQLEFLLTREPLDIVRISTALFVRVEEGEWTGNLEKEVENFENILQKVLERVPSEDVERKKKL
ncbi:hypothetical protein GLOIN_2v1847326 [Rhizophagus irregularis DAOM 181602=DAOM 197198]|uniref:Uncharacterized protein n=1 Tax=Rhizophagus irregularis (strain DAOM 181602 / DAOM 197198 / MUCL 43194) TaxID=747089 RepID=A0A2P4P6A1_RHIID|nr:hypothetical protein GLOIN_2v1847326 [Rhizophagus irregularis DAOM 181602=DAOM 197198]POG60912.1 hypothetical protein GLOIN_2v1847326 [Rhizophagus irregularis DAOM 181602=DAOM 197198]|eukprot:XP_025167778.1 hypothetical protein GLOIN_2v1847326 [Rhizophagus irregularis DAOM 181602=DAOM 197198]